MQDGVIEQELVEEIRQLSVEEQQHLLEYVRHRRRPLLTAQEILDRLTAHRNDLQSLGVVKLGLFGSYSRGEATPDSDMDFVVEFDAFSLRKLGKLTELLESLFDNRIDLGIESSLRDSIRPQVTREVRYVQGL